MSIEFLNFFHIFSRKWLNVALLQEKKAKNIFDFSYFFYIFFLILLYFLSIFAIIL